MRRRKGGIMEKIPILISSCKLAGLLAMIQYKQIQRETLMFKLMCG